jgi:hypothetical protein
LKFQVRPQQDYRHKKEYIENNFQNCMLYFQMDREKMIEKLLSNGG